MLRDRRSVSLTEAGAVLLHEIGVLFQRVDDRTETVERRLTVYLESTVPLVA